MTDQANTETEAAGSSQRMSRRAALARLGLATATAYAVPSMLQLDRAAKAGVLPSFCPPPGSPIPPPPGCFPGNVGDGGPGDGGDEGD